MKIHAISCGKYKLKNRYFLLVLGCIALILSGHNIIMLIRLENFTIKNIADIAIVIFELIYAWQCFASFRGCVLITDKEIIIKDYYGEIRVLRSQMAEYNVEKHCITLKEPLSMGKFLQFLTMKIIKSKKDILLSPLLFEKDIKELEKNFKCI